MLLIVLSFSTILDGQDIFIPREKLSKVNADIDTLIGIRNRSIRFGFDTLFFLNQIAVNDYINTRIKNASLSELVNDLIVKMDVSLRDIQVNYNNHLQFINYRLF